jgi:hypothetical protein
MGVTVRYAPPVSAASVREIYLRYAAGRLDLDGVLLPGLLPHDACRVTPPPRVKVLFVAESPPWAAGGGREVAVPADCRDPGYPYFWNDRYVAGPRRGPLARGLAEKLFCLLGLKAVAPGEISASSSPGAVTSSTPSGASSGSP